MKIASTLLLAVLMSGITFAQDVPIPDFIKAEIDDFDAHETYFHGKLPFSNQGWIDKDTNYPLAFWCFVPQISTSVSGDRYSIGFFVSGSLPKSFDDATQLKSFQIKTGNDAHTRTIEFDSFDMRGIAIGRHASYSIRLDDRRKQIYLGVFRADALSIMKKMAYQTAEKITTVRLDLDKGELTMDVPLSVSRSVREFYEWAQAFYKAKGLTWPDTEE